MPRPQPWSSARGGGRARLEFDRTGFPSVRRNRAGAELASPSGTGFGPTPFNYGAGSFSMVYSCDEDKLFLNFTPESDVFPPLQFDRKKP